MKKKSLALIMAIVMVFGATVGATLAYMFDITDPIVNTFTVGNIDITLTESKDLDFKMVPGNTITKDPKVTVVAGSEACWLFVKVEESASLDTYIAYTVAEGWTELTEGSNVYYRSVDAATAEAGVEYAVLAGNAVTVNGTVEKDDMDALEDGEVVAPTLTFTAYACQSDNLTVEAAWAEVNK